ncbi:MAG TPA: ATP-binding protein [Caldilineaceae bacterium]|nr:ATP-binding protein [Caldilineaceae bacterium]
MDDPLRGSLFAQRIVNQRTKGGLGLLFVRLLVEQLGGRIQLLDYTEQHGACFCLYLPHILGEEEVNIVEAVR